VVPKCPAPAGLLARYRGFLHKGLMIMIATTGVGVAMLVVALVALAALAITAGNDPHRRSSSSPN